MKIKIKFRYLLPILYLFLIILIYWSYEKNVLPYICSSTWEHECFRAMSVEEIFASILVLPGQKLSFLFEWIYIPSIFGETTAQQLSILGYFLIGCLVDIFIFKFRKIKK